MSPQSPHYPPAGSPPGHQPLGYPPPAGPPPGHQPPGSGSSPPRTGRVVAIVGAVVAVLVAVLVVVLVASSGDDDSSDTTSGNGAGQGATAPGGLPEGWVVLTDDATGISAAVPEGADSQTDEVPLPGGGSATATAHLGEIDGSSAAGFSVIAIPAGTQDFDLQGSAEGSAANIGGTLESTSTTTFAGREALDFEFRFTSGGTDGVGFGRVFVVDSTHVVQVLSLGESDGGDVRAAFDVVAPTVELPREAERNGP